MDKTTDKTVEKEQFEKFFSSLASGIDIGESAKWSADTQEISRELRDALIGRIAQMNAKSNVCDERFLDYCNAIKALLAVYNFGNLSQDDAGKKLIKTGITRILAHVERFGYDISPNIDYNECTEIFGSVGTRVIPVTLTATTVLTTLVYLRRAIKRKNLFEAKELTDGEVDLNQKALAAITEILNYIYGYIDAQRSENRFQGWGVTLDYETSKAITLCDTYAVVDALSRFADAFTKDDEKNDQQYVDAIDALSVEQGGFDHLAKRCIEATYKTAFNLYTNRDIRKVYGKNVFYFDSVADGDHVKYSYVPTTYDQIASSTRSSALFNPLYIAMITMYGYNDREVVIRHLIDNPWHAKEYYEKYETECPSDSVRLSQFAAKFRSFVESGLNFEEECARLTDETHAAVLFTHQERALNWGDADATEHKGSEWRRYYEIARVFQRYLEIYHPEELLKISEYRDYLNATKDAIDQTQVMYRDFDNNQRLGIVDTDYVMFSSCDVDTDKINISKLNKASIAVNNLRPLLLSSKIMIVNALTKYPQADMGELYNAIIDSRHRIINKKQGRKETEWLWNEDEVDMNSTARHCEAIMYDYFDYYERYELGFKAMRNFRSDIGEYVKEKIGREGDLINLDVDISDAEKLGNLKQLMLEVTKQNLDIVKDEYKKALRNKDDEIARLSERLENIQAEHAQKIEELNEAHRSSLEIGNMMKSWIREEVDDYFHQMLSAVIINNLNEYQGAENFNLGYLLRNAGEDYKQIYDAKLPAVRAFWNSIAPKSDEEVGDVVARYQGFFRHAIEMQSLFEAAFDGVLEKDYFRRELEKQRGTFEEINEKIWAEYGDIKHHRRRRAPKKSDGPEETPQE